ncbi:MAG: YjdF family protein [Clostridia bacterium]|nr:YjdF family protein [Clostridia bacterium]
MNIRLTVYFEDPFWIGIFERLDQNLCEVSKIVFGPEPKDYEVYEFILENQNKLVFSIPIKTDLKTAKQINHKKLMKKVRKETSGSGTGTKAQQALKTEQEQRKKAKKEISKKSREEQEKLLYKKRKSKKLSKKRGH